MRGFVQREDDVRKANDLFATSLEKMRKDESMSMFFDVIKDSGGSFQETPRQTFCSGVKSVSVFWRENLLGRFVPKGSLSIV